MFIAPGCNGIRGAVTMGMIALIVGYLYRFRSYAHAAFVVAAILLGYLFNFVRLCTLVLYYILALHITRLQPHGEMADYIIGATLFLFATWLLTFIVRHAGNFTRPLRDSAHQPEPLSSQSQPSAPGTRTSDRRLTGFAAEKLSGPATPIVLLRFAAMSILILTGTISVARAYTNAAKVTPQGTAVLGTFPARVGQYTLARSWNEYATGGPVIFQWADYAPADVSFPHIAVGISPVLGSHDTLICHSARGEDPIWHAELPVPTAGGPTSFSASFFADGATQYLEATTLCQGSSCGEYSGNRSNLTFVYSRPSASALFTRDPQRPIPVMLRAETTDTALPADLAREQLTAATRSFLAALNLDDLTRPYRH